MKSILIDLKIKGKGIVNFDSKRQKMMYRGDDNKFKHLYHGYKNINYSKKVFYIDNNGKLTDIKIKISDKCIKKAIYGEEMVGQNTNFVQNQNLLFSQIGSPIYMLSGYMLTVKNGLAYKRKSPITLTDAIQTNNAFPALETLTRSGFKDRNKSDKEDEKIEDDQESKGDTSLFTKESVNDITYDSEGSINLKELQFVSLDDYYDRWSFNADEFPVFENWIKKQIKSFNSKPEYFKIKSSQNSFPELGIRFSNKDVDFMVKYFFEKLLKMRIYRNSSYAETYSLRIKIVNDPLVDTRNNPTGWIELNTIEDIKNLNIVCDEFYEPVDEKDAIEIRKNLIPIDDQESKKTSKKKKDVVNKEDI